jgi:hypothetical protein
MVSGNVVSLLDMKDRMSDQKAADTTTFFVDPTGQQLTGLLDALTRELAAFCSEMKAAIEEGSGSDKERGELIFCQLRVLQDVLRAIAILIMVLPPAAQLQNRGC